MDSSAAHRLVRHLRQLIRTPAEGQVTDRHLLERFAGQRDEAAFQTLVERHGAMVLGVGRRLLGDAHEAEDVFQATFLVLARQAEARHWRASVAPWLYQVAYRLALKTRTDRRRRQAVTRQLPARQASEPEVEASRRELARVLDEEVQRLPDRYRLPIVLCYLEGQGNAEAAGQLGWRLSTLKGRLARARAVLRGRLSKRGLALTGAAMLLPEGRAPAAVPGSLTASTVRIAALLLTTDAADCGGVSAVVTRLAEGMLHAMWMGRIKVMVTVMLALVLTGGAGLLTHHVLAGKLPGGAPAELPEPLAGGPDAPQAAPERPVRTDRFGDPLPEGALARLGTVRFRHGPRITSAVFSPDGKLLATSGAGRIDLWEAATGKLVRRGPSFDFAGTVLAFSPGGQLLAVNASPGPRDTRLRLLDVATGNEVRQLDGQQSGVQAVAFSPDGNVLASGGTDKIVRLWDPATGRERRRLEGHQKAVFTLAFAPDGKLLATGSEDQTIRLWDVATGSELGRLSGHQGSVYSIAFAPGGAMLASGGEDKATRIWDVATRKEIRVLNRQPTEISAVAFLPDGRLLISGGDFDAGSTIALWDVPANRELRRWKAPGGFMRLSGFSADGKTLVSVSFVECGPRLWDVATGREVSPAGGHHSPVHWLAFAPDGKTLTSGEREKVILRWDLGTGRERTLLSFPTPNAIRSALSPDGKTLATWERQSRTEGIVRLWDPTTGQELHRLGRHQWTSDRTAAPSRPLAFAPDSRQVASVDRDRIVLWDVATGRKLRDFLGPRGEMHCVTFAPDGRTLAAGVRGGSDRSILAWDSATGKERYACGPEAVEILAFSPDGRLLASASYGLPVQLWDAATGKERRTLTGPSSGVYALAFSPDGKLLAGAGVGQDDAFCLWEVLTGQEAYRFIGQGTAPFCLAFAPDGRAVASGNLDSTILLWDLTSSRKSSRAQAAQLNAQRLEALWDDLGGDAAKAHAAVWRLVAAPGQVVPWLHERLRPVPPIDSQRLHALIAGLGDNRFAVREQAAADLEKLGELAEPALRKELAARPALEVQRRLERLLEKLETTIAPPDQRRALRAIVVLERIGDQNAREVLRRLARGAPEARLTGEAKAALGRLAQPPR